LLKYLSTSWNKNNYTIELPNKKAEATRAGKGNSDQKLRMTGVFKKIVKKIARTLHFFLQNFGRKNLN